VLDGVLAVCGGAESGAGAALVPPQPIRTHAASVMNLAQSRQFFMGKAASKRLGAPNAHGRDLDVTLASGLI
jgi:hypothetical protein